LTINIVLATAVLNNELNNKKDNPLHQTSFKTLFGDTASQGLHKEQHVGKTLLQSSAADLQLDHRVPPVPVAVPVIKRNIPRELLEKPDLDLLADEPVDAKQHVFPPHALEEPEGAEGLVTKRQPAVELQLGHLLTGEEPVLGGLADFTGHKPAVAVVFFATVGDLDKVQTVLTDPLNVVDGLALHGLFQVQRALGLGLQVPTPGIEFPLPAHAVRQHQRVLLDALFLLNVFLGAAEVGAVDLVEILTVQNGDLEALSALGETPVDGEGAEKLDIRGLVLVHGEEVHHLEGLGPGHLLLGEPPLFLADEVLHLKCYLEN